VKNLILIGPAMVETSPLTLRRDLQQLAEESLIQGIKNMGLNQAKSS
jgi:DeoR/GlpR family transcriptional regulator of sugar metabolism